MMENTHQDGLEWGLNVGLDSRGRVDSSDLIGGVASDRIVDGSGGLPDSDVERAIIRFHTHPTMSHEVEKLIPSVRDVIGICDQDEDRAGPLIEGGAVLHQVGVVVPVYLDRARSELLAFRPLNPLSHVAYESVLDQVMEDLCHPSPAEEVIKQAVERSILKIARFVERGIRALTVKEAKAIVEGLVSDGKEQGS